MKIILASSSPYRRQLLERLNFAFETASPDVDETPRPAESGRELAERLAAAKAKKIGRDLPTAFHEETLIIGSDQVAECQGRLLGKPMTQAKAIAQLGSLSGQTVIFHTAVAVLLGEKISPLYVPTRVGIRTLTDEEIARYISIDQPLNCSGALKTESLGIGLMTHFSSDDPTAIIGLPLIALSECLRSHGIPIP